MSGQPDPEFDFDCSHIAVSFAMRLGLYRLAPSTRQPILLVPGSALQREKAQVERACLSRHAVAGFDPAVAMY